MYKIKTNADGFIDRYKAHLFARGFSPEYDINYEDTFASVVKMTSICTLISLAATCKWPLYQMNVKNAFFMMISLR